MTQEALKLALEALVMYGERHRATYLLGGAWDEEITLGDKAITALEEALVQPEQEPLEYWNAVEGWVKIDEVREHFDSVGCGTIYKSAGEGRAPLFTTPPQRTEQCNYPDCKCPTENPCLKGLAQPEQEPVIGTKTWFEDGKMVTQHLTAKDIYKEPEPVIDKSAAIRIATSLGWTPQRTWVGLTGLDQKELMAMTARDAVFATEAKLKEKNT